MKGVKKDSSKLKWDLLPIEAVEQVVRVLMFGARKYSPDNWKRVPDARNRYYAAALRHIFAWRRGSKLDPESKKPHIAHAVCCLIFILWLDLKGGK